MTLSHWDEVDSFRRAKGEMDATWQPLGHAAGTRTVGVNRVRVAPRMLPTPPHSHTASEEVFFVLALTGLSLCRLAGMALEGERTYLSFTSAIAPGQYNQVGLAMYELPNMILAWLLFLLRPRG